MSDTAKLLGTGYYWNDLTEGERFRSHRRTVTETDLVQFLNLTWLTEELFTDASPGQERLLPGRVVPGALIYSFAEGLVLPIMQGTGLAFLGAEISVKQPTVVGDTIYVECEVLEARRTSRPGRGLVRTLNRVMKQTGEEVLTYNPARLIRERPMNS